MKKYKINGEIIAVAISDEEMQERVGSSSSFIKTMTGIGNNAAWSCCLEAMDQLRRHVNFKQRVKRGFNDAMSGFRTYENQLVYAKENRLFHVADLTPPCRKRYGNITDREYYDFWASTGATAFTKKRIWVMNLWNKYRISLNSHRVPNAETVAWGMTAAACIKIARCIYANSLLVCIDEYGVPKQLLDSIFGQLDLSAVDKKWDEALILLEPFTETYDLSESEQKNIQLGIDQLHEELTSMATLTDTLTDSIGSYGEVFRTQGEQKKALRKLAELRG